MARYVLLILFTASIFTHCTTSRPWGTTWVKGFFADDTEITVAEWLEFVYYQDLAYYENYNRKKVIAPTNFFPDIALLPDLAFLDNDLKALFYQQNEKQLYFTQLGVSRAIYLPIPKSIEGNTKKIDSILSCPISGITYDQANEFCTWRTKVENIKLGKNSKFHFHLPTLEEYEIMNTKEDSLLTTKTTLCSTFNYASCTTCADRKIQRALENCGTQALPVASFKGNKYGLYDIQGNLCEMTIRDGVSYGGSYLHAARFSIEGQTISYKQAKKWVGFRTVYKK
ncbi:formylglycine-generating enzyme required for sulfatase activity [Catalinimonas alkaloidigena]|uniref:SUMF1/EgtB/PvdO family nonheme iron enzyme n=1 Tax=Catalinimonas alkaloidigena TaxID=1075417 RepID=UPI0024071D5F|nr:SUMF1/EgtB/PvdO family nonheme iron enzyme [Catalinimonas alkaloidigena]MDF9801260.1 formylglycine-generating enzyme required for sulfatase activity [Catalinimonas alkaloidigena]